MLGSVLEEVMVPPWVEERALVLGSVLEEVMVPPWV